MKNRLNIQKITFGAVLTAIVVILQLAGAFIHFGPFSISLVLVPILIGAALYGPAIGAWLGGVFGLTVLLSGDAALFLAVSVPGTIITVMLKGILCGFCAGLVYKLIAKKNKYVAVMVAAVVCPVVNTGVFLLGCLVFFMNTLTEWAAGGNVYTYMIVGLVGFNFVIELVVNVVLGPVIIKILSLVKKNK